MPASRPRGPPRGWAGASAICTLSQGTIAHMPCNPAIGGTAKGHLVREIDALGGLMGRAIDATGIQFKLLESQPRPGGLVAAGPGGQAPLQRVGRQRAPRRARHPLGLRQGRAHRRRRRPELPGSRSRTAARPVLPRARDHDRHVPQWPGPHRARAAAGRAAPTSRRRTALAESLKACGFRWGRLKTGTPPRLDRRSIDFSRFDRQEGDDPPVPFSFTTDAYRPRADRLLSAAHDRAGPRARPRPHRRVSALQRPDSRASVRAIARRSKTR